MGGHHAGELHRIGHPGLLRPHRLWQTAKRLRRPLDRLRLLVKPPGWPPEELGGFQQAPDVNAATYRKWDTPVPRGLALYGFVQFTMVLLAAAVLLFRQGALSNAWLGAGAVFFFVGCDRDRAARPYVEFVVAVGRETFVLRATDPETIRLATENFRGRNAMFPIGPLLAGDGGFNAPWPWHFDPDHVRMAEIAIEICDGRPSYVAEHLQDFLAGYCPWGARVVGLR